MTKTSLEEIEALQEDKHSAALTHKTRTLLSKLRNEGIPLSKTLQRLVQRSSTEVVESAIAAFKEQQEKGNVKVPTAFMIRAIQQGFQPGGEIETQLPELEEFQQWYKQNKGRILATYSHSDVTGLPEGQIGVMLRGSDHWVYWRDVDADASSGGSAR
jgi:anti-sigma28 factor (negative regulator of flagellin synthesis)